MFVPSFKILGQVIPEKSMTKISIFIPWGEKLKKGKIEKEGKSQSQHLEYTWSSSSCIQNLKILALIDAELI